MSWEELGKTQVNYAKIKKVETELTQHKLDYAKGTENLLSIITTGISHLPLTWEQGTITINGDTVSNVKIRTKEFLVPSLHPSMNILIEPGYQFNIVYFDVLKNRIGESGWKTALNFSLNYPYIRVVVSKISGENIIPSESENINIYETLEKIGKGEVGTKNIANRSITPDKTAFLSNAPLQTACPPKHFSEAVFYPIALS